MRVLRLGCSRFCHTGAAALWLLQPKAVQHEESLLPSAIEATTPTLRKTALHAVHRQLGAKMVDFNGWDMPVEYPASGGLIKEHLAVRGGVGLFDVSHMGDIRVHGPEALKAVQHI